jgi:L-amino acid N-acyltransferase YncA
MQKLNGAMHSMAEVNRRLACRASAVSCPWMLDDALERYPASRRLEGDLPCVVRPLREEDERAFIGFLNVVPEIERLFIKPKLGSPGFRKEWFRDLDYDSSLTLVASAHDHFIGMVTLQQRQGGWKRHIGRVHCLTHPEYRDVGVSGLLVREIIDVALHAGLTRLEAEFNGERGASIRCFENAGFQEMLRMKEYLHGMKGDSHDWVLMGMEIRPEADN